MPALSQIDAKMVQKRSTVAAVVPTIPTSNDHTDGSWNDTDIYSGEFFINEADEKIFVRIDDQIKELSFGPTTAQIDKYNYSFSEGNRPYFRADQITYLTLASFIYEGTGSAGTQTRITISWTNEGSGAPTSSFRLYDLTNSQTIYEFNDETPATQGVFEFNIGVPANLPAVGPALFEVQMLISTSGGGRRTWINSLLMT